MTRLVMREWFADAVVVNLGLVFVLKLDKINVIKRVAGKNKKKPSLSLSCLMLSQT